MNDNLPISMFYYLISFIILYTCEDVMLANIVHVIEKINNNTGKQQVAFVQFNYNKDDV